TVRVWHVATGQVAITLPGHEGWVTSVAFSADGTRLASAGFTTVKVWDAATGKELLSIPAHKYHGCELRLMSSVKDAGDIPSGNKNLIIVAAVNHVLHFRIFDGDGKMAADTDETRLTEKARPIEELRKQMASLWPPHELTGSEKRQIIDAVTSIVG